MLDRTGEQLARDIDGEQLGIGADGLVPGHGAGVNEARGTAGSLVQLAEPFRRHAVHETFFYSLVRWTLFRLRTLMEQATQVFAAISFLVIGLSHLCQPKAWVGFFQALAARGTPGVFVEGFLLVNFGTLIVAFHNVWHGPELVLTLIGWAQVVKGVARFVAPQVGLRVMQRVTLERAWHFKVGGAVALLVSGFLWWLRFRA